jgi:hypothetical protein
VCFEVKESLRTRVSVIGALSQHASTFLLVSAVQPVSVFMRGWRAADNARDQPSRIPRGRSPQRPFDHAGGTKQRQTKRLRKETHMFQGHSCRLSYTLGLAAILLSIGTIASRGEHGRDTLRLRVATASSSRRSRLPEPESTRCILICAVTTMPTQPTRSRPH